MKRTMPQAGFSLIELLVALVIITILATAITGAFDGSHSRAQTLVGQMAELGNANVRLKNDTGCYVNMPQALYDATSASSTSNNYCGRSFGKVWNGPYVNRFTPDSAGSAKIDKVSAEAALAFGREDNSSGGKRYFVHATNVPNDIIKQAMQACNDTDDMSATFDQHKCRAQVGSGTTEVGDFDMMYDETR